MLYKKVNKRNKANDKIRPRQPLIIRLLNYRLPQPSAFNIKHSHLGHERQTHQGLI